MEHHNKQDKQAPIDPLYRVFVPVEKRNLDGTWAFRTSDKQRYVRDAKGVIRRVKEKRDE